MNWAPALAALLLLVCAPGTASAAAQPVPRPACQAGDLPETALQGQVPVADRVSGRAAMGYRCNLREVGGFGAVNNDPAHEKLSAWANFDVYRHCAYYGDGNAGTIVADVSDPLHPVQTAYLEGGAMASPWESLRVNGRRGLLVADHQPTARDGGGDVAGESPLDIYEVSRDCAHPRKLFSGKLPHVVGHEGWFQPDGMVYYATNPNGTVVPIDISDPAHPKELALWDLPIHGGSVSDDGTRGYFCENVANTEVLIVDTSDVQARTPNARYREIGRIPLPDTQACQETYPVTYGGHPYVIQFGEWGETLGTACPTRLSTHSRPHMIDVADERNPRTVATLMNEVAMPENCEAVAGDRSAPHNLNSLQPYAGFSYGSHMCHPDRLHDPTLLACAEWLSGLRVYDIRDPLHARELAYFNTGTLSTTDATVDMAAARPVIRPERGEIWLATIFGGFHVLRFEAGAYPFPKSLACPAQPDWFVDQYARATAARCVKAESRPSVLGLPSTRGCVSRRAFRIHLRKRRLRSARVYVDGKLVRVLKRAPFKARIDLRGFPAGRVLVRIVARTRSGHRLVETRRYRTCVARRRLAARGSWTVVPQRHGGRRSAPAVPFMCRLPV